RRRRTRWRRRPGPCATSGWARSASSTSRSRTAGSPRTAHASTSRSSTRRVSSGSSDAETGERALRAIPFFADLSDQDLEGILAVGQRVSFQPGEVIVEQGQPGDAMFVVLAGRAEVDVGGRYHAL